MDVGHLGLASHRLAGAIGGGVRIVSSQNERRGLSHIPAPCLSSSFATALRTVNTLLLREVEQLSR